MLNKQKPQLNMLHIRNLYLLIKVKTHLNLIYIENFKLLKYFIIDFFGFCLGVFDFLTLKHLLRICYCVFSIFYTNNSNKNIKKYLKTKQLFTFCLKFIIFRLKKIKVKNLLILFIN